MTDVKAKWQRDIEVATGPISAVAQLLNARIFDLETTIIAQAAQIKALDAKIDELTVKDVDYDALSKVADRISRGTASYIEWLKTRGYE